MCRVIYIRLNLKGKKGHQTRTALTNVCVWKVCWHCILDGIRLAWRTPGICLQCCSLRTNFGPDQKVGLESALGPPMPQPWVGFASALGRISVSAFVLVSGPVPDSVRITDSALNLSVGFGFKLGFGLGRRIGFAFDFGFGFAFRLGFIISFGVDFGFWFGFGFGFSLRLWCGLC